MEKTIIKTQQGASGCCFPSFSSETSTCVYTKETLTIELPGKEFEEGVRHPHPQEDQVYWTLGSVATYGVTKQTASPRVQFTDHRRAFLSLFYLSTIFSRKKHPVDVGEWKDSLKTTQANASFKFRFPSPHLAQWAVNFKFTRAKWPFF